MSMKGPLQTPFEDAVAPVHDGSPSGGAAVSGGFDLGDGSEKETANTLSGLPPQITTFDVGDGSSPNTQVPWPPVDSPGTSHPPKP